mgnify:CR=1 FL=1
MTANSAPAEQASADSAPAATARAQCPYCGVGCGLELKAPADSSDPQWTSRGDRHHPSSLGQVCVKGATVGETLHHNRLTTPLWRERLDQPFAPISWDRAFQLLVARIRATLEQQGPGGLAIYGSGQFLSEDYYVANKLLKGALGSNNFDANSRLCMSSAVAGYTRSLGSDGPPCCYDDLDLADLVLLIGTNTAECHPVLFQRLIKRKRKVKEALRLVVVDPRHTATAEAADLHLAIRPGTDLVLLHGIGHLLLELQALDQPFIAAHTEGYAELEELWQAWTPQRVSDLCGIAEADLRLREVVPVAGGSRLDLLEDGRRHAFTLPMLGRYNAWNAVAAWGAARALGLSRGQVLRCVQLPLALPVMLAGLRTATSLSVGTATMAAFIGAGGYGERIVTGLALNDSTLLLAGARPARWTTTSSPVRSSGPRWGSTGVRRTMQGPGAS